MLKPKTKRNHNLGINDILIVGWPVGMSYLEMADNIEEDLENIGITAEIFEDAYRIIRFKNKKDLHLSIISGVIVHVEYSDTSLDYPKELLKKEFEYVGSRRK